MDWYLVSSQLYFTINLEEIFYFNNKKYRIYAVFGVSQTPICGKVWKGDFIMGTYNVHAGHCPQGQGASGAVGILQESVEDRIVKNEVILSLIHI